MLKTILHWRMLALCLIALALFPTHLSAQTPPPDILTYNLWLREAFAAAQRSDEVGLRDAAKRIVATNAIRLADGSTIPVDNSWLRDALDVNTPDLPTIARRLGVIIDALNQPTQETPAAAMVWLQETLANPPFSQPPRRESLIGKFLDWLLRQIIRLFEPINASVAEPASAIAQLVGVLGGLFVVAVLIYWLIGLRRTLVGDSRLAQSDDPDAHLTAQAALQQATLLARDGDYRTAVRYLYLSALLWLDERGRLRYDRSLTNREYLERLRDTPALRTALTPVVETFDRVWYGHMPLDATSFANYRQQVEALRTLAEQREQE